MCIRDSLSSSCPISPNRIRATSDSGALAVGAPMHGSRRSVVQVSRPRVNVNLRPRRPRGADMPMHDRLHVRERSARARPVFADRTHAGRVLTEGIAPSKDSQALVLALPRGGIPVGRPIADAIGCVIHPVLVRKLPTPVNPE